MKTLKLISTALLLCLTFSACNSNDDGGNTDTSCTDATSVTAAAQIAFNASTATNHDALCAAYKTALQAQIAVCGDQTGALQAIITDLGDCTLTAPNNGTITVTVGESARTFSDVSIVTTGTTRKVTATDAATSYFIYFEIQQSATGANVISNFKIHLITKDYTPLATEDGGNFTSNITVNSATAIQGTFFGYVTSSDNAVLDLTSGVINVTL